jgi:adenine-specific DNA-methyltransferase
LTENILAYRGSSNVTLLREPRNEKADSTYSNPDNDPRGPWTSVSYVNPASKAARPNLTYPLTNPITKEKVNHPTNAWKYERSTYEKHVRENRLYWGQEGGHTYPRLKKFLSEMEGMVPVDLWKHGNTGTTDSASKLLEDEFGKKVFEFPKPPSLVKRIIGVANFGASDGIFLDYFAGTGPTSHAVIDLNREDSGKRKYILVEMGDYFDTVLKPRIEKVVFTKDWKNGKPVSINCNGAGNNDGSGYGMGSGRGAGNENGSGDDLFDLPNEPPEASTGVSHCFKYLRLESYEDTLNNLEFTGGEAFSADPELYKDYLLHYLLDLETQGSASLLSIEAFADPFNYKLKVKKPGGEESELRTVDLPETFNYLLGLRVEQIFAPQRFSAEFERLPDLELPEDQKTKLTIKGRLRLDTEGPWTFRKLEGRIPKNRFTPNDGVTEKVLVIWRVLTGDQEQDNLVLDEFFRRECMNPKDTEFDTIYVNGSNNLPNLKRDGDNWKVRLIEEDFMNRMWEVE